jgi:hypothetical protein
MFGEIVSVVVDSGLPVDDELLLGGSVTQPVVAHGDGLAASLFDSVVQDSFGCVVVGLYWGRRLDVA